MNQISDTSAAYLAGLIDGEGSIGLFINHCPTRRSTKGAVIARLKIGMCDEALIKWLQSHTESGTVTSWKHKESPKWKPCWVIAWHGRHAAAVINAVWPYLRLKRPQAKLLMQWIDIAMEWQAKLGGRARTDRRYPDSVWTEVERLALEIKKLNQKGTSV